MHDLIRTPERFGLPTVNGVSSVSGGVVHHVWAIETVVGRFYAKVRSDRLAGVPHIRCEPRDIEHEATALSLFAAVAPRHFPRVIHSNASDGLLIMTDVVMDGETLEQVLLAGTMTPTIAHSLGVTLREIHESAKTTRVQIRGGNETAFAVMKLEHKLGPSRHPAAVEAMRRLAAGRQLILGDPSPKNVAYHRQDRRFAFFDLEDAHHGHPSFDKGFLAGHLLLHNYLDAPGAERLVVEFCNGYGDDTDTDLAQLVGAAIFHYRLNSIIPYCVNPDAINRTRLLRNASATLTKAATRSLSWREVTQHLLDLADDSPGPRQ